MFCSKCGAPLSEDAAFCSKCGNKVADTETALASGRTDSAETAVKETPHLSAETDAALKHKSKLCFFLAFFPLILTVPIGGMSGVMAIPWANSAVAVPLYVAGWFFFVKRHGFGRGAAAGVTALFSLLGASLVPIIPICAWHVWHLRMIYPEKRPTVNDHLVLAILSQLAVVPCIVIGTKLCMIGSDYLSVRAEVLGALCFACALPASWALKNSKKVASFNLELKSGKDEAESTARKAKWLAIAGFVLPIAFFAVFCFVFGPQSFSAIMDYADKKRESKNLPVEVKIAELKGSFLVEAMSKANGVAQERGFPSVWPHKTPEDGLDRDLKDKFPIASVRCLNADVYFGNLLDISHMGSPQWKPYVKCSNDKKSMQKLVGALCLADGQEFKLGWMVAEGLTYGMPDSVPVLVSANVDPKKLVAKTGRKLSKARIPVGKDAGRDGLVGASWDDEYVVVVRKSGKAETIPAADFSLWRFYGGGVPEKRIEYLDVK